MQWIIIRISRGVGKKIIGYFPLLIVGFEPFDIIPDISVRRTTY